MSCGSFRFPASFAYLNCMILRSIFSHWGQLRDSNTQLLKKGSNIDWCSRRKHDALTVTVHGFPVPSSPCLVCVRVRMCEQVSVCVIEADSLQLRVITVGLYLFLSRSLLCQILAVFAVVVYGPFWFRDSWALLLPGLRSPDLGCPLLPCATRLSPTESSASAYGKLRFCLRKLRLCPTESSASAYGSSASALRKAPLLPTEAPPLPYGKLRLVSRCVLLPVINSLSATESSRLHCDIKSRGVKTFYILFQFNFRR